MEGREMQRHVGAEVVADPAGHRVDLGVGVVLARYQQRGQFEPGIGFRFQVAQRVEHRFQVSAADLPVETLRERLQVDVDGVHRAEELLPRPFRDIARGDGDVANATFAARGGRVDGVFEKDDRIVVGVGDTAAVARGGGGGDVLGRSRCLQAVEFA